MGDHVARADLGLADQKVKMLGDGFHPRRVAERKVVAAKVDHRQKRAEEGDRGGEKLARVEEAEAQRGLQLFAQCHQMAQLRAAGVG